MCIETGAIERDFSRCSFPVRRPRRKAVVRGDTVREVAVISLFRRHGDNLAAELERCPGTGRGEAGVADVLRSFRKSRPGLEKICRDADLQPLLARGSGIV